MNCPNECGCEMVTMDGEPACPECDGVADCNGCGDPMWIDDGVEYDGEAIGRHGDCYHPSCQREAQQDAADVAYEAMISRTY